MSRIITIAATLLCLGGAASFAKSEGGTKSLALNFTLCTAAIALTSEATDILNKNEQNNKFIEIETKLTEQIEKLETEAKDRSMILAKTKKLCDTQAQDLSTKAATIEAFERQILTIRNQFERKTDELNYKLGLDDKRYSETIARFRKALIEDTRSRIKDEYNQLYTYITHKLETQDDEGNFKHAAIHKPLQKLKSDLEAKFPQHCDELYEINALPDDESVLAGIEIYSRVCAEIANFKGRYKIMFSADRVHEAGRLAEELEDVYTNLSEKFTPKNKAIETLNEYHQASNEKLKNLLPKLDENDQSLAELHAQVSDLLNQIDLGNLKIANLNQQIEELSKPLQFFGTGNIAVAGNSISMFYYKNFGYRLDAITWTESETGYDLVYAIRQNPGLSDTELYQGNCREQLASFTNSLFGTLPEFTPNYQNCSLSLKVILRKAIKKELTAEDIFRECDVVRADKFGSTIQKYHIDKGGKPTLRVMSSTGGGKGIAIKNLIDHYTQNVDGYEIWLSDPQDGSSEDYWMCPKVARDASQSEKIFAKYVSVLKTRDSKSSTDPATPILGVFDEFDKKHSRDDKKTASEIWTTIRHQNMRLILIGQCGEVGRNGWTWDDMNNCGLLFIENAIDTFIKHASKDLSMKDDDLTKFKSRYDKISKWMAEKNRDIDEVENHYRIACLYVSGRALLLEIPYALKAPITSGKSWLVSKPFESPSVSTNTQNNLFANNIDNSFIELKFEEMTQEIGCPKCGSINIGSKGDDFNRCRDCNKTWAKPKIDLGF